VEGAYSTSVTAPVLLAIRFSRYGLGSPASCRNTIRSRPARPASKLQSSPAIPTPITSAMRTASPSATDGVPWITTGSLQPLPQRLIHRVTRVSST
jgi:hypothetical protein